MARVLIVIPARYASQRFPAKVLADLAGKPMIQWVWERAKQARKADEVLIATDDVRVEKAALEFGAKVAMTSPDLNSGTERAAEVAGKLDFSIVVNLQGDEPLFSPKAIDQLINAIREEEAVMMASLRVKIKKYDEFMDPNVVKVVCDDQDYALYFSRSPIPFHRGKEKLVEKWKREGKCPAELEPPPYKHLGIYAYYTDFLKAFAHLPVSALEQAERLEQLRALAWGFRIKVPETEFDSVSVDVPADLEKVASLIKKGEFK
jgi:3-deoxy-manno-octulosonate cytidylyltransferase (CMP-KDO synthetase)